MPIRTALVRQRGAVEGERQVGPGVGFESVRGLGVAVGAHAFGEVPLGSAGLPSSAALGRSRRGKDQGTDRKGDEFVQANLLGPLELLPATGGPPFLSTLVKLGEEMTGHGWKQATIMLVGDGLVIERPPGGGKMIRFGIESVAKATVEAFMPLLRPLRGSCVILAGAGAGSKLPDGRLRESQKVFRRILEAAGVEFVSIRSPDLPRSC